jgi:glycosyltransferase involved in cell wall biosynthesis
MSDVKVSLVAPCLNEAGNVAELAERFFKEAEKFQTPVEIVFIDDGSTDETLNVLENLKMKYVGKMQIIQHQTNKGIPASWFNGTSHACGEFVCLIDSDLQNPPESVFEMLSVLDDSKVDLVRAVRKPVSDLSMQRFVMSRVLNYWLNRSFGMKSHDNKSGFVIASKEDMIKIVSPRGQYRHFQTFIGAAANFYGLTTKEIDTAFHDRRAGVSFMRGKTIRVIFEVLMDVSKAKRDYRIDRAAR